MGIRLHICQVRLDLRWILRQGLARQHVITVGRVRHKTGHDDGRLHHVTFLHLVIHIQIGMMGAAEIIQFILNELKTGHTNIIKTLVIGAPPYPETVPARPQKSA